MLGGSFCGEVRGVSSGRSQTAAAKYLILSNGVRSIQAFAISSVVEFGFCSLASATKYSKAHRCCFLVGLFNIDTDSSKWETASQHSWLRRRRGEECWISRSVGDLGGLVGLGLRGFTDREGLEGEECFFEAGFFSTGESIFLFRLRDWLVGVTFLTGSREEGLVVAADGD